MAGPAEQIQITYKESVEPGPSIFAVPNHHEIYTASEVEYEALSQARFEIWVGSLATKTVVETDKLGDITSDTNLLENLQLAKAGSIEALNMVSANVASASTEVCFKDRHVTEALTSLNEYGERMQFGQSTKSVNRNAITLRPERHPILQEITHVEALNDHRLDDAIGAGKLNENYFVVVSIVPDEVPEIDLGHKGDGYFLDSLTFVIQATTEQIDGIISTESGFMAGVESEAGDNFEDKISKRYDIKVLTKVYERLGKKAPTTAAEFLNEGLYIPKYLMPHGVVDFMRWCDEAADDIFERSVERDPKDYVDLIEISKQRETSLKDTNQKVVEELLAAADDLSDPIDAIKLMWQLVRKYAVEDSFKNKHIDPKVFGAEAAFYIKQVRHHIENGTVHLAQEFMKEAFETSVVSGCGGGSCGLETIKGSSKEAIKMEKIGLDSKGALKDNERTCKECGAKMVVYDLKNKKKGCLDCGATTKY